MDREELTLVKPAVEYREGFLALIADFEQAGEHRYSKIKDLAEQDFAAYVRLLEEQSAGSGLSEGYVPMSTFWLVRGSREVIGVSHLRHRLNLNLEHEGGHIGYHICPSERGKGYGFKIMDLTLERLRSFGWSRVLVTCDADNTHSARIIEKHGGKLSGQVVSKVTGKLVTRYWIDL